MSQGTQGGGGSFFVILIIIVFIFFAIPFVGHGCDVRSAKAKHIKCVYQLQEAGFARAKAKKACAVVAPMPEGEKAP